ncbi:MAG: RNA methyltransferase [Ruminococcus sp.]|jgi:TrmH family RNA methyltransferase|nr:RNA methyltransferase [Ruminococcus sp.]
MKITSPVNDNIKLYKSLTALSKARRETGLFTLEGLRLISDADIQFHTVFYTPENADKINGIKADRLFEITEEIAEKISDTKSPQGLFAIAEIPHGKVTCGGKILVLHSLRDPGNLGTIIRAADAFGISGILAIDCADIYSPKTVRAAMGALFRANIEKCDEETAFEKLGGYDTFAAVLSDGAETLGEFVFPEKSAIFIGNEANGLPDETIEKCKRRVTIKMRGNAESLNAASAASILLYEFLK